MTFLVGLLTYIPGFLSGVLSYLNKKQDVDLEKFKVDTLSGKEVSIALVQAEIAGKQAQKEMNIVGMNHPIWWVAWAIFVLPVGLYHASIFLVSTFDLDVVVKRVPQTQEEWGMWIVMSLFGAQVATGLVNGVATRWLRK